eukprot:c13487_g1_i1 orf=30-302(-)
MPNLYHSFIFQNIAWMACFQLAFGEVKLFMIHHMNLNSAMAEFKAQLHNGQSLLVVCVTEPLVGNLELPNFPKEISAVSNGHHVLFWFID